MHNCDLMSQSLTRQPEAGAASRGLRPRFPGRGSRPASAASRSRNANGPSGRPIVSAARNAATRAASASSAIRSATRPPQRESSGVTSTSPSSRPARCARTLDHGQSARNELLEAEAELRRLNEQVAAQRRALPAGGLIREDYVFESAADGSKVRFSELFAPGKNSLVNLQHDVSALVGRPTSGCPRGQDSRAAAC
jgi:hypothetical protein